MHISIGNDHAGPALKKEILSLLNALGPTYTNHGTVFNESVDYRDSSHPVAVVVTVSMAS